MWPESNSLKGISRFNSFGLRQEWLHLYFDQPGSWMTCGQLGSRQELALKRWLHTLGIVNRQGEETAFGAHCRACGLNDPDLWQELWVRAVFHFNGLAWYVYQGCGEYTAAFLRHVLAEDLPMASPRTIANGIIEVLSFLERTPIGSELGQGRGRGRQRRTVVRTGLEAPSLPALELSLSLLFQREGVNCLKLDRPCLWPWTVFGASPDAVRLLLMGRPRFAWDTDAVHLCPVA